MPRPRKPASPFRYFNSSPEVIRLVVMMYVRFPLSLRSVEDLLFERGIDLCHETVRLWWNRFGPVFAADIRRQRVQAMRGVRHWRWHLDEMYVRLNGEMVYLWRAVDHEGEILESYITKTRAAGHNHHPGHFSMKIPGQLSVEINNRDLCLLRQKLRQKDSHLSSNGERRSSPRENRIVPVRIRPEHWGA